MLPERFAGRYAPRCRCGGIVNHFIDGSPARECTSCGDARERLKAVKLSRAAAKSSDRQQLTTEAVSLVEQIDDLLTDATAIWAEDTLQAIRRTVMRSGHCTQRQQDAIDNIEAACTKDKD